MLAAMIDGLSESGASEGAGAAGVKRDEDDRTTTARSRTAPTSPRCCRSPRCAGATSGCCSRCRARASATPRSPRSPTTSSRSASRACGPAMAITEPGTGSDSANISTTAVLDGDEYVINGEKIFVTSGERADAVVVWATLDKTPGPGGDQVVRGREGHARHDRRAARAQARHQGLRHRHDHLRRLPGAGGEPARLARDRHQAGLRRRDGDLRQHPPAGRRDGRRLRPGRRSTSPASCSPQAGVDVDYDRPALDAVGRGREVPPARGRLGGRAAADAPGRLDGRQPQAQLAGGLDGQGEGRPGRLRRHAVAASSWRARSATARPSCWRSGPATPRSSTSSRAPSRSSS